MLAVFRGTFDRAGAAAVWDVRLDLGQESLLKGLSPGSGGSLARPRSLLPRSLPRRTEAAQEALSELVRYSLLEWEGQTRRYRLHDLARDYAACLAGRRGAGERRSGGTRRTMSGCCARRMSSTCRAGRIPHAAWRCSTWSGRTWRPGRPGRRGTAQEGRGGGPAVQRLPGRGRLRAQPAPARAREDPLAGGGRRTLHTSSATAGVRRRPTWATSASPTATWARVEEAIEHYRAGPGHRPRDRRPQEAKATDLGNLGTRLQRPGPRRAGHRALPAGPGHRPRDRRPQRRRRPTWATSASPTAPWARSRRPSSTISRPWPSPARSATAEAKATDLGNLGIAYSDLGQRRGGHRALRAGPGHRPRDRRPQRRRQPIWATSATPTATWAAVEEAIEHYEQALAIAREIGDRRGEGDRPGQPRQRLPRPGPGRGGHRVLRAGPGHRPRDRRPQRRRRPTWATWATPTAPWASVEQAIEHYEQALAIAREIGDRRGEGRRPGQPRQRLPRPGPRRGGHRALRAGPGHRPRDRRPQEARATGWATSATPTATWAASRRPSSTMSRPWPSPARSATAGMRASISLISAWPGTVPETERGRSNAWRRRSISLRTSKAPMLRRRGRH